MRLLQVVSRDVDKYALFTSRSANQSTVTSMLPRRQYRGNYWLIMLH